MGINPKIIIKSIVIGEGEGVIDKYEDDPPMINDGQMWTYISDVVNKACTESIDYRYLGHFIEKAITTEAKSSGSMGGGKYLFDWELYVVLERESK